MATHEIRVDYSVPLAGQPDRGHNRWHPDIAPVVRCEPGDEVVMETRDAFDGQLTPDSTPEDVADVDLGPVHPLTGPVYVEGAEPGDLLVIDVVDVTPPAFGFTVQVPGLGSCGTSFLAGVAGPPRVSWNQAPRSFPSHT